MLFAWYDTKYIQSYVLMPYNGCVMPHTISNWLQCLAGEEMKQAVIDPKACVE